jgi:hypothetical protein
MVRSRKRWGAREEGSRKRGAATIINFVGFLSWSVPRDASSGGFGFLPSPMSFCLLDCTSVSASRFFRTSPTVVSGCGKRHTRCTANVTRMGGGGAAPTADCKTKKRLSKKRLSRRGCQQGAVKKARFISVLRSAKGGYAVHLTGRSKLYSFPFHFATKWSDPIPFLRLSLSSPPLKLPQSRFCFQEGETLLGGFFESEN